MIHTQSRASQHNCGNGIFLARTCDELISTYPIKSIWYWHTQLAVFCAVRADQLF